MTSEWTREIVCGANPPRALRRAIEDLLAGTGQVWDFAVHHEDGCPALGSRSMAACTCELVRLEAKRLR